MNLSADLREFIELLNSRGVEYVIVGAHSLAFHGRPRYTGDLDILVRPSPENVEKLTSVLTEFGFAESGLEPSDFTEPDQMIQLGRVPNRIDLLTGITGVVTNEAFEKKIVTELAGLPVYMLSKDLLIQNKRAVARPQDLADLDALS
jgi:predicted nucleotidyltransferase